MILGEIILDGATVSGIGIVITAVVGFFAYQAQKRANDATQSSDLVDDALRLREAAQAAYNIATAQIEAVKEEANLIRQDMEALQQQFTELQREVEHWRKVAFVARETYRTEVGRDPFWWQPYEPER